MKTAINYISENRRIIYNEILDNATKSINTYGQIKSYR